MRKINWQWFGIIVVVLVALFLWLGAKPPVPLHTSDKEVPKVEAYHRVASFGAGINEIVLTVAPPSRSVAIGRAILNTPALGKEVPHHIPMTAEAILEVHPDLIILPSWASKAVVMQMKQFSIPVEVIPVPTDIPSVKANIRRIGDLLEEKESAERIIANMEVEQEEAKAIADKGIAREGKQTALYLIDSGAIGGIGSTANAVMEAAGLINGVALAGLHGIETLPKASVVAMDPDVILVGNDIYTTGDDSSSMLRKVYEDPAYKQLKAVKNKRVYVIDSRYMASTSQFITKGAVAIAKAVYGQP